MAACYKGRRGVEKAMVCVQRDLDWDQRRGQMQDLTIQKEHKQEPSLSLTPSWS